jgi:chromosome segregation ATPase
METRKPKAKQPADPDLSSIRSSEISFEEQVEIIGQINEIIERNRIEIKPDTFAFTAKKKGSLIPLLINAGALLVLAAGAFTLLGFFNRKERSLITESATVLTAEGKLIEALREESEERLDEKDRQIAEIQTRLEGLRQQAESARLETEARIREREEQLRSQLEDQLAAERQKLQEEGLSSAAIADQLESLEQRLISENEARLARFRSQSEAELAEKEEELAAVEQEYRQSLVQFQQERAALQQQFDQREAELRAELERQAAEAQSAQAEVEDQLARLREQRQREQLVFDQIVSSYRKVQEALGRAQYQAALRDLDALESYLSQASIAGLPAVQDRIPVERFLIASLRRLIEAQRSPASGAVVQTGRAPPRREGSQAEEPSVALNELQEELERSRTALSRQAQELDRTSSALSRRAQELDRARTTLDQRTRELDRTKTTLDQRTKELDQAKAVISRQSRQIDRYESAQREIGALREEASSLRRRYASISSGGGSADVSQDKVLALVDTKLQVREVLASQPVRRQYPELYEAMEEYFDTYGKVQLRSGREDALKDAIAVLDDLSGSGSADLSAMKRSYGSAEVDLFAEFLRKLEALLE